MTLTPIDGMRQGVGARALQRRLARDMAPRPADPAAFAAEMRAARLRHDAHIQHIREGLLRGDLAPVAAGRMIADAAARDVRIMAACALAETARRRGPVRGVLSVLALGKLGGAELTLDADLDLMVVFAADDARTEVFAEATALLLEGLTRLTEDGALYEVDLRLRPYGDKGPAAVQASSFKRYFAEECWTFEAQSLTRARPIAGDSEFGVDLMDAAHRAVSTRAAALPVSADVAAMRARLEAHKPALNCWDVKLAAGGLIDVEFIVQALMLQQAASGGAIHANTGEAIAALARQGALNPGQASALASAWTLYTNVRHLQKALRHSARDMTDASAAELAPLLRLCGEPTPATLRETLVDMQRRVRGLFCEIVGAVERPAAAVAAA